MNTEFMVAETLITLHPVDPCDKDFLLKVYASTREDEMSLVDWCEEQKSTFIKMQFDAQTHHYRVHFPQAEYHIIKMEDVPIGRLILNRSGKQILIIDIALLPKYRNKGIGTEIVKEVKNDAEVCGRSVVLHVEFFNPVINLYSRLGFVKTTEMEVYHEMEWIPGKEGVDQRKHMLKVSEA